MGNCTNCHLHRTRKNQVVGRGQIPADILFIGEAPGPSEDVIGEPFVGPSGRLLDLAIGDASNIANYLPSYYITNTIQCIPLRDDGKFGQPKAGEVESCMPNLLKIVEEVEAVRIVFIGDVARKYLAATLKGAYNIRHPAYLLRRGGTECPEYRRTIVDLAAIFDEVRRTKDAKEMPERRTARRSIDSRL